MSKYPGKVVSNLVDAGYSVYFDGTDDLLYTNGSMSFTGQFACEAWFYRTLSGGSQRTIFALNQSVNNGFGSIRIDTDNANTALNITASIGTSGSAWAATISFNSAYTVNQWTHVLVTRDSSNVVRLFINGILRGNVTVSGTLYSALNNHIIGANYITGPTSANQFQGYISNVRVINGSIPTEYQTSSVTGGTVVFNAPNQLFNVTNTAYLTCNSPSLVDQSNNAFTITTPLVGTNAPVISSFTPFTAYVPYNPALGASTPGVWMLDEALQAKGTRRWNMYDPYFNQTTLLLRSSSADGTQNNQFLDSSTNNFGITRNGNPTQGSFSPFNHTGWAVNFNRGRINSTLTGKTAGTGSFTYELFFFSTDRAADISSQSALFSSRGAGNGSDGIDVKVESNGSIVIGTSGQILFTSAVGLAGLNSWYHLAVVRNGSSNCTVYLNGALIGSFTFANNFTSTDLYIGIFGGATNDWFRGYISNFRYTRAAVYTGNFTVPTAPLDVISNTEFLTCASNRFVDLSANAFAITLATVNGASPTVQPFGPSNPTTAYTPATIGGSGYFDGTVDSISVSSTNTVFNIGASVDFTYEAWFYSNSAAAVYDIISLRQDSTGWAAIEVQTNTNRTLSLNIAQNAGSWAINQTSTATFNLDTWNHIAVVRSGGSTVNLYLNGVSILGPFTNGNALYSTQTEALRVGARPIGGNFVGYITNVRFILNQALTTGTFTPPVAPVTATSVGWTGANVASSITGNVGFVCNFTNAAITDATGKNNLETAGNAQASVSVRNTRLVTTPPTSIYFDGNGDYLQLPSSQVFAMGSGDWTVEMWVYPNSVATLQGLLSFGSTAWRFFINNSGLWFLNSSTSIIQTAQSIISTGQWYHVAVCKSGSSVRIFLNGAQVGATGTDNNTYAAGIAYIGSEAAGSYLNGYIDDLRVTRGVARYTTTFTPPRSRLQEQ